MRYGLLIVALCFMLVIGGMTPRAAGDDGVITLDTGTVRGVNVDEAGNLWAFKGIPFASPPVGDRRWQPPAPLPAWGGERAAGPGRITASFCPLCLGQDDRASHGAGRRHCRARRACSPGVLSCGSALHQRFVGQHWFHQVPGFSRSALHCRRALQPLFLVSCFCYLVLFYC